MESRTIPGLIACALLAGCATGPDLRGLRAADAPLHAHLEDVPYTAGGAAGALAMLLAGSEYGVSQDEIGQRLAAGADADALLAVPRGFGRVSYPVGGSLTALLADIDAGLPVLVRLHDYAVVVGYDLERNEFIVHRADRRAARVPVESFDRAWRRHDRWAMVAAPPDTVPASVGVDAGIAAIHDYQRAVGAAAAGDAWIAATEQWPRHELAWFARGEAHGARGELAAARDAMLNAVHLEPTFEPAWLQLGRLFAELGERGNALSALRAATLLGGPWQAEARDALEALEGQSAVL